MSEILTARGLHKSYREGRKGLNVLNGIDLSARKGAAVFIVGPSGAGKSTLLHLLGGLDRPDRGSVIIDGMDIFALSDRKRSRLRNGTIGFVFQFYHLLPEFTALENVMMPALMASRAERRGAKARAEELLSRMGLSGRLGHMPQELSGGERQRVAIARAVMNRPKVLFCDEPTGNLDSKNSGQIYDLLFEMREREGLTLVVVTHQADCSGRGDFVFNMKDGLIL